MNHDAAVILIGALAQICRLIKNFRSWGTYDKFFPRSTNSRDSDVLGSKNTANEWKVVDNWVDFSYHGSDLLSIGRLKFRAQ